MNINIPGVVHFDLKNQFPVRNLINGDVWCVASLLKLSIYAKKKSTNSAKSFDLLCYTSSLYLYIQKY